MTKVVVQQYLLGIALSIVQRELEDHGIVKIFRKCGVLKKNGRVMLCSSLMKSRW